jgi:tRNA-specific 2-thiouridylase
MAKDQSYFLWDTPQQLISRLLFPLGEFASKEETRALAVKYGLGSAMASKSDSTNLCFFGGGSKEDFLAKHGFGQTQGNFLDADTGAVVGKHTGYEKFVPGQRAGIPGLPSRKVVLSVIPSSNTVIVTEPKMVETTNLNMVIADTRMGYAGDVKELVAVARYRSSPVPVEAYNSITGVLGLKDGVVCSPGQSVVFYHGDEVVGGGVVASP